MKIWLFIHVIISMPVWLFPVCKRVSSFPISSLVDYLIFVSLLGPTSIHSAYLKRQWLVWSNERRLIRRDPSLVSGLIWARTTKASQKGLHQTTQCCAFFISQTGTQWKLVHSSNKQLNRQWVKQHCHGRWAWYKSISNSVYGIWSGTNYVTECYRGCVIQSVDNTFVQHFCLPCSMEYTFKS